MSDGVRDVGCMISHIKFENAHHFEGINDNFASIISRLVYKYEFCRQMANISHKTMRKNEFFSNHNIF